MPASCKSICLSKYGARPDPVKRWSVSGLKRCVTCGVCFAYDGVFCPCCGMRLRTRTQGSMSGRRGATDAEVGRY